MVKLKINLMIDETDYVLNNGEVSDRCAVCLGWFPKKYFTSLSEDKKRYVIKKELGKITRDSFNEEYDTSLKEEIIVTEQGRHDFDNPRFQGQLKLPRHLCDEKGVR